MGYACPVCDDPQVDARHLANHLAFTAILGHEDHEAWLDEHTPGWADEGEAELADRVAEHAEERDYPQVFEDTTGHGHDHDAERSGQLFEGEGHEGHDHLEAERAGGTTDGQVPHERAEVSPDGDTEAVLEEARELTREMLAEEADEREDGAGESPDAEDA
jgi:hypothetical protein